MILQQPFFSIIVPTYARPKQLTACIQAIARLDYPRDRFEVIVVDDGSPTRLESVVTPLQKQLDIKMISQPHAGPAAARNTGAAKSRGEVLAFTDDDCRPAVDWLKTLAIRFTAKSQDAIGGRTVNALPESLCSSASQMLLDYLYAHYNTDPDQSQFVASNNIALPADRFHSIGAFDSNFPLAAAEDRDLCDRWVLNGYRLIYAKEVIVYHAHALTFRTFLKQHFTYGQGASHFHRMRKWRGQRRIGLEPLPFYLNLLRYPFSKSLSRRALLLSMLLMVSQSANGVGYLLTRKLNS